MRVSARDKLRSQDLKVQLFPFELQPQVCVFLQLLFGCLTKAPKHSSRICSSSCRNGPAKLDPNCPKEQELQATRPTSSQCLSIWAQISAGDSLGQAAFTCSLVNMPQEWPQLVSNRAPTETGCRAATISLKWASSRQAEQEVGPFLSSSLGELGKLPERPSRGGLTWPLSSEQRL